VRLRFWLASLAGRTALLLIAGFAVVQAVGLGVHTYNQMNLERLAEQQRIATGDARIYRQVLRAAPGERDSLVKRLNKGGDLVVALARHPAMHDTFTLPLSARQTIRGSFLTAGFAREARPHDTLLRGRFDPPRIIASLRLPDDSAWLIIATRFIPPAPWRSPGFATAFIAMFLLGAPLILWAVHHLTAPIRTLAAAAEQLGRDVTNAPGLPEDGPTEIAASAIAFNTMAGRIRRFIEDRTFLLTAIGHDLRTPITRLKLRTEFLDDEEQQAKFRADLDELEAMVAATLAFGRDVAQSEGMAPIDLATLLRTLLDEAADADPEAIGSLSYSGLEHLTVRARPLALKRALANLIGNALKYGNAARVRLGVERNSLARVDIEDDGPGIPAAELERVFEPFRRIETSRNRETGGTGLGLAIARNAIRAHGGEITLANRAGGGLVASVTLPL
jgi:signal transduction histidine kinase